MTEQASEVSGTSSYAYDEHGELVSEIDGRGIAVTRTVDEADRVTLVNYPGTDLDTSYVYGTNPANFETGRLLSITHGTDVAGYTWDRFGRLLTYGELAYAYDKNGNRTQVTYPGDLKAISTFDRMDREASLTLQQGAGPVTTVVSPGATYKAYGPLASMVHPTTTARTVTRDYDLRYAPTAITVSGSQLTWSYTVDAAGNPTAIQQTQPAAVSRSYGYQDTQYFLTSASGPWNGPLSWSYDKIGNRLTETRDSITDSYSYEPNSALTGNTATLDLVTLGIGGTRDYGFDAGGYLDLVDLGANDVDFTFDAAGQLARTERAAAGESAEHRYDGRGFLRQVTASMPGSGGPPGGDLPFLDGFESGDVCAWSAAIGAEGGECPETVEQTLTALYDSAGNLRALDSETNDPRRVLYFAGAPIAIYKAGPVPALTILTTDHLGTPIRAMDAAGATTWLGGFEPFGGEFTTPTAAESGVFLRFPGQWSDAVWEGATLGVETYYNVHRWYETGTGRYASIDPLHSVPMLQIETPRSQDPELFSPLYGYATANPLSYIDPLGLLQYKGCSDEQRSALAGAIDDYCKRAKDDSFKDCMCDKPSIPGGLSRLCGDPALTVRCKPDSGSSCSGNCAWSVPFGRTIRICPGAWDGGTCGPLGCTLMHEMTHQLGHGREKYPQQVEKCLGCP
jgi:RHS repeat-associated protein